MEPRASFTSVAAAALLSLLGIPLASAQGQPSDEPQRYAVQTTVGQGGLVTIYVEATVGKVVDDASAQEAAYPIPAEDSRTPRDTRAARSDDSQWQAIGSHAHN